MNAAALYLFLAQTQIRRGELPPVAPEGGTFWMPPAASTIAPQIDAVFYFIYAVTLFFFALIVVLMGYFVIRYRQRAAGERAAGPAGHSTALEVTWTAVPLVLVGLMFYTGFRGFMNLMNPPAGALDIRVLGQKWRWAFTYPNGHVDDELHLPLNVPVRLILESNDVIHSLFIPAFRIKRDAVPGRYNKIWFQATRPGEYLALCTEFCGTGHSDMLARVVVHEPGLYEKWLEEASDLFRTRAPAEVGQFLVTRRCGGCHTVDGSANIGPTFKGLYEQPVPLADGRTVTADDDYIRESILEPRAKIVRGFEPVMPTFKGQLNDREITAIIDYLKAVGQQALQVSDMSASDPVVPVPAPVAGDNYLTHTRGIRSWLLTVDHKRIGVLYLVSILTALLLGGIFALLIRTELLTSTRTIVSADNYNRFFTLHGAIMIFLVIIPSIPAALGNFVLPIMLGARDLAFPRLNLFSYYLWVAGALLALLSIALGSVDTGWTFYVPYATTTSMGGVVPILFGVFLLGFSSVFTGLNFVVTIHKLRPPGMTWFQLPLFAWTLYATAIVQILATPVLGITVLLLIAERTLGIGIFQPGLGGDALLYQHFFWFYSHPAVYIMILPAMGVVSEIVPVFSRKHIFGYHFIAFSGVAIAVLGFFVWGHHMFVSGQSPLATTIFSLFTYLVAIPSAIKTFNWLATMHGGSIALKTPMLYTLAFIFVFGLGGLTGLFLGALSANVHLHGTYFIVAHFHYVMMGSAMTALVAGLHYWWPKITGRMYSERLGRLAFVIILLGFNLTFFPQFILGSHGMPRRYYNYPAEFASLHQLSTVGSYLLTAGFVLIAVYLLRSLFTGPRAPANPWGGATLEWACDSPPPTHNFDRPPAAGDPYDYSTLEYDPHIAGYVRASVATDSELGP